jgi:putative transposase
VARIKRIVAPHIPHHVVQRGNRRQQTFFNDHDYALYLRLLTEWCQKYGVRIWAYCLMPNHVHLILVPATSSALARAVGEAHRRYTRHINFREDWRGHLWQGRFHSYPMDERHLLAAARYVEQNPVKAGIVGAAWDYRWSSAAAHVHGVNDGVVDTAALLALVPRWREFLTAYLTPRAVRMIEKHETSGRPAGEESFIESLEGLTGVVLKKQKTGPKNRVSVY